eukprot:sb/3460711/
MKRHKRSLDQGTTGHSPLSPALSICAYAGPMKASDAREFRRVWKTPPRELSSRRRDIVQGIMRSDSERGLERVGRDLAVQQRVPWREYWPFMDAFVNLREEDGLILLEKYLANNPTCFISSDTPSKADQDVLLALPPGGVTQLGERFPYVCHWYSQVLAFPEDERRCWTTPVRVRKKKAPSLLNENLQSTPIASSKTMSKNNTNLEDLGIARNLMSDLSLEETNIQNILVDGLTNLSVNDSKRLFSPNPSADTSSPGEAFRSSTPNTSRPPPPPIVDPVTALPPPITQKWASPHGSEARLRYAKPPSSSSIPGEIMVEGEEEGEGNTGNKVKSWTTPVRVRKKKAPSLLNENLQSTPIASSKTMSKNNTNLEDLGIARNLMSDLSLEETNIQNILVDGLTNLSVNDSKRLFSPNPSADTSSPGEAFRSSTPNTSRPPPPPIVDPVTALPPPITQKWASPHGSEARLRYAKPPSSSSIPGEIMVEGEEEGEGNTGNKANALTMKVLEMKIGSGQCSDRAHTKQTPSPPGREMITVDVVNKTSSIVMHMNNVRHKLEGYEMNVTSCTVQRDSKGKPEVREHVKVTHAYPFTANSFYVMQLGSTLEPGRYYLTLEWRSRLVEGLDGIYLSSYKENGEKKWLLASQMEPLAARKVMPCFDEPDMKAVFKMTITTEKKYPLVLWNMPQKGEPVSVDDTYRTFSFEKSVKMSTYLLAFVIADFKCTEVQETNTKVKVRTCGRGPAIDSGDGGYSADITRKVIDKYEEFYGTDFPLRKIDSVAVPDFSAGAMENWGLILYRETALLYNTVNDTISTKSRVNTVVSHELAHQAHTKQTPSPSGRETITVDVVNKTSSIVMHMNNVRHKLEGYEMNVTSCTVQRDSKGKPEDREHVKVTHAYPFTANSFYVMQLGSTLEPGRYYLTLEWRSRLVEGLDGIYLSSYKENGEKKWLLASQMEPLAARKVMPCFDEPDMKAVFKMTITTEKKYPLVLWNMPQKGEPVSVDDTYRTFSFEKSVKMSTYLLAFVIADFKCTEVQETNTKVKVRTCGRGPAIDSGDGGYSADITRKVIDKYEEFYGTDFPLRKIDSVAVPDFSAGAMENWGLILYRETALLYNTVNDTISTKSRVNTVVSHELAHQWFGNLVTMKWWNDLWLNEGFASYVEWIGTDASEPFWNNNDFQTYSDKSAALSIDSYMSSRPTSVAFLGICYSPAMLVTLVAYNIVSKFLSLQGSAILRQAKMFMDPYGNTNHFEEAIKAYIKEHKYGNAVQMDLYGELDKVYQKVNPDSDVSIKDVMSTWTLQMNFPVLKVARFDEDHVAVSQERFLIAGEDTSGDKVSPYSYQWYVPVKYVKDWEVWKLTDFGVRVTFILIPLPADLRRHNYVEILSTNYQCSTRLRYVLTHPFVQSLTTSEKQGMIFDTFLMISSGMKPMSVGLELLGNVLLDTTLPLVPWKEVHRQLAVVGRQISENSTLNAEWKAKWKQYYETLYEQYKEYFSVTDPTPLPDDDRDGNFQKRQMIVFAISTACQFEVSGCITAAKEFFQKYREENSPLPTDFKSTILKTVMGQQPVTDDLKDDWEWLWGRYLSSPSAAEQQVLYYALGLIQDSDTLIKYSTYCLNDTLVRPSDALYIMGRSITQTKLGREVSLQFLIDNWAYIHEERFAGAIFAVDAYVFGVLSKFSDQTSYDKIKEFFVPRYDSLGPATAAYESVF